MKLLKTTISPISNFATPLQGDILFGHICIAIKYLFGEERLNTLLDNYDTSPFLIISDGFISGYLPKPNINGTLLGEKKEDKKTNRKKIWLTLDELIKGDFLQAREQNHKDIKVKDNISVNIKNSLNYKTFTTDKGNFTPYGEIEMFFAPKDVYCLIAEKQLSKEELKKSFDFLSQSGYGKNISTGKGRFNFSPFEEININNTSNTFMTLSPCVLSDLKCKNVYYEPIVKFGKHSFEHKHKNPFKKPIIMANSASIIEFENSENTKFVGKAIRNFSSFSKAVHQGFSIVIPTQGLRYD